jgi:hypothetical protein
MPARLVLDRMKQEFLRPAVGFDRPDRSPPGQLGLPQHLTPRSGKAERQRLITFFRKSGTRPRSLPSRSISVLCHTRERERPDAENMTRVLVKAHGDALGCKLLPTPRTSGPPKFMQGAV